MLLTILANNVMLAPAKTSPGGGYIRQRIFEDVTDPNIERIKKLKKEDEILLMVIKTFVENL